MLILPRYILREHLKPFLFGVSIITLVFLLNLVFRELGKFLSRGLGFRVMAEFFFLNLAWIIALSVPMAVLLATLMAFGRLSGDGEIIGMKAGGISILRIIAPVIVASALLALFLIWFNNHVLPDANYRTKLLAYDISRKRPTLSLEPGVVYRDIENYTILVESLKETPDTSFVTNIYIEDNSRNTSSVYIWGKRGKIYLNRQKGMLFIYLYDGEMHELNLETMEQYRRVQFPQQLLSIAVPEMVLTRSKQGYRGDREKSAQMMLTEIHENETIIRERLQKSGTLIREHIARLTGRTQWAVKESPQIALQNERGRLLQQLKSELRSIDSLERENSRLMVEVHKKYSIPVACVVFVLVGAPLGIMARKGSMAIAGSIAFVFFLIYWASLIGGEELADNRYISPFIAMWGANILCGTGGIYLIIYSIHETTFINFDAIGRALTKPFRRKKAENAG
ncbi:MAG: LptF/LptG family permease [candidate division KSB1 bacterium]|nr:LptF/LptG family permease [candidate division KSB1 bacterium]